MVLEYGSRQRLFSGITVHSQFLGPMLTCIAGWDICDMIFVEKKFEKLHLIMLFVIPIMMYATRSRAGFLSFAVLLVLLYFYCLEHVRMRNDVRSKINAGMLGLLILMITLTIIAEVRNKAISRWLRKTDLVAEDQRSLSEALTASRQSVIFQNMRDFRRAPLLGSGFQVAPEHQVLYKEGYISLFSAPVEKGLLPLMVLGETGIIGATVFAVFLIMFYVSCSQKGYYATITLFTVFLSTNMAEATFFSPGGGGGIYWMMTVVGGFIVDMMVGRMRRHGDPNVGKRGV